MKYEIKTNRSIRLKVTEKCSWDCIFCHKEGGWAIDDVLWNDLTKQAMVRLQEELGITEIHYTGGEPTNHKNLESLTAGLVSLGLKVKTTSNGQCTESRLTRLSERGLKYFNFSVHSLDPSDFIKAQRKKNLGWAGHCIDCQKRIIQKAISLGANVKINTVVSSRDDSNKALGVYNFGKRLGVQIRFLNDLGKGKESVEAIDDLVLRVINARKVREKVIIGSSSMTDYYRDKDGYEFGVKKIREYKLASLCKGCKEKCMEQFYGIRMEQKGNEFFIRLCLNRKDGKSYMPFETFLRSEQLIGIKTILDTAYRKAA